MWGVGRMFLIAGRRVSLRALAGFLTVAMLVLAGTTWARGADAGATHLSRGTVAHRGAARGTSVRLAIPSGGDLTYGVAQVRIDRRAFTPASGGSGVVFAQRVGGLAVVSRSEAWSRLRRSLHVYVVVSPVAGAGSALRNIAFFLVRRRGGSSPRTSGAVSFSIPNARPEIGSFWVRGVDRRGNARIFAVRDILSTAVGNWARYLVALKIAHALAAARHPADVSASAAAAGSRRGHGAVRLSTGGQRADALTHQIFGLVFGSLRDPIAFASAKRNPLVVKFITKELRNPSLADRWKQVVMKLPLHVPDSYAAAAQEEARFGHVRAPRLSARSVVIADAGNSSSDAAQQTPAGATPPPPPTLTVQLNGSGAGVVESSGSIEYEIFCSDGATETPFLQGCSGVFLSGATVTLTATADPGSAFAGWSGAGCRSTGTDLGGDPTCTLVMPAGNHTLALQFTKSSAPPVKTYNLNLDCSGSGFGSAASNPPGAVCDQSVKVVAGRVVTLTATPGDDSTFGSWTGCDSSSGVECTVVMNADKGVEADFVHNPGLTIKPAGSGSATITSSPAGIDGCDESTNFDVEGGGICSTYAFRNGQTVTLTAVPAVGTEVTGWSGCDFSSGNTCTVEISPAKQQPFDDLYFQDITVTFAPVPTHALHVYTGASAGAVTSSPSGISCGSTCSATYNADQTVTLTAAVPPGYVLDSWSGCDTTSGDTCTVAMSSDRSVWLYTSIQTYNLTIDKQGTGTVTSSPSGINCGSSCVTSFPSGQSVTLTAAPASGSTLGGWSGCDSASGSTCTVSMNSARTVTASFRSGSSGGLDPTFGASGVTLTPVGDGGDGGTGIVREGDGSLAVVGSGFDSHGNLVPEAAHYSSNGVLDQSFGSNGLAALPSHNGDILFEPTIAYQSSTGDLIVAGTWESPTNLYTTGDLGLVRLKPDGTVDMSFGTGGIVDTAVGSGGNAYAVVVNSSGEIYVGGSAAPSGGGDSEMAVVAYTAGGALDSAFNGTGQVLTPISGGNAAINALALDGGSIVGAGSFFDRTSGNPSIAVIRYTSAGTPDSTFHGGNPSTFNVGTDGYAHAVLVQASHKIVVGGVAGYSGGVFCMALGRLNADGSQDTSFGSGGDSHACFGNNSGDDSEAYGLASDGTYIYAAGNSFINSTGLNHVALARFSLDGTLDTSFGNAGYVTSDADGSGNASLANGIVLDGSNPVVVGQAHNNTTNTTYYMLERFLG